MQAPGRDFLVLAERPRDAQGSEASLELRSPRPLRIFHPPPRENMPHRPPDLSAHAITLTGAELELQRFPFLL